MGVAEMAGFLDVNQNGEMLIGCAGVTDGQYRALFSNTVSGNRESLLKVDQFYNCIIRLEHREGRTELLTDQHLVVG